MYQCKILIGFLVMKKMLMDKFSLIISRKAPEEYDHPH